MGFKHQPKTYRLVFADPALEGLEVRLRSMSIDALDDDNLSVNEAFADALISWNLEYEDGTPVPQTLEAIRNYPDIEFISVLTRTWITAISGVDDELGKDSASGKPFPEASIPMEPLSPSLAS